MFGSSLCANVDPFASSSRDWFVMTVPLASEAASVTSN